MFNKIAIAAACATIATTEAVAVEEAETIRAAVRLAEGEEFLCAGLCLAAATAAATGAAGGMGSAAGAAAFKAVSDRWASGSCGFLRRRHGSSLPALTALACARSHPSSTLSELPVC